MTSEHCQPLSSYQVLFCSPASITTNQSGIKIHIKLQRLKL